MANKIEILYYKNIILSITQYSKGGNKNIAKPILFLAILNLIDDGHIIGNKILFDNELTDTYKEIFSHYSEIYTLPVYPFYFMRNDGFYHIKGKTEKRTPSTKYVRENVDYAYLDDGLWELLQDPETREEFRQAIISHYLTTEK